MMQHEWITYTYSPDIDKDLKDIAGTCQGSLWPERSSYSGGTCCTHMLTSAWRAIQRKHKAAAPVRCISCHSRAEEEPLDRLALLGEKP